MKKILPLVAGGILAAVFLGYLIFFFPAGHTKIITHPEFWQGP